jgi:hypothetical protein
MGGHGFGNPLKRRRGQWRTLSDNKSRKRAGSGRRRQTAAACLLELTHATPVKQETAAAEAADVATAGDAAAAQHASAHQAGAVAQQAEAEEDASPLWRVTDEDGNQSRVSQESTPEIREQVVPPPCPPAVQSASAGFQTETSFDQDTGALQELLIGEVDGPLAIRADRQECVDSMFGSPGRQGSLVGKYVRIVGMVTEAYAETETVRVLWDDHETRSTVPVQLVLENLVVKGRRRCARAPALGRGD